MKNSKQITIRVDQDFFDKVESIRIRGNFKSKPAVMEQAFRDLYKSYFPSYKAHQPPMPNSGSATEVQVVAQRRVANKVAMKQAEANEIIENGTAITRLLSGVVVNLAGGVDQVSCRFSRMDNGPRTVELTNPMFFTEMRDRGIWNDERPIEQNDVLQVFLLEAKFRDLNLSDEPEKVKKKLENITTSMKLGIERGNILAKDFSAEVLICLFLYLDQYEVDYTDLKEAMTEANFALY